MKKAMIFAAGLGTRLRPLTNDKPKALVEIQGQTLLEININKLAEAGIEEIVVNVHHFADKVIDFLASKKWNTQITISDERDELLETGGGLKKAAQHFQDDFLVYNVDIISNINIEKLFDYHEKNDALATLAVRKRATSRYLLFDENHILHAWIDTKNQVVKQRRMSDSDLYFGAFSGIHVISPRIFPLMKHQGKFSIIDTYLDLAKTEKIQAYLHNEDSWLDVGKPENLEKAVSLLSI